MINGKIAFESLARLILEIEQATKRQAPTGGVIRAILRDKTIIIPKWTGAIPMLTAIGWSIGPSMIRAAAISMNIPTTSMRRMIRRRTNLGFPVVWSRKAAIAWGTWLIAKTHESMDAVPMIKNTEPVIFAVLSNMGARSLKVMDFKTKKPMSNAYNTATEAASVGVKSPERIPPSMIIGIRRGIIASFVPISLCFHVDFGPFGYPRLKER
jgi:hypothetical protein